MSLPQEKAPQTVLSFEAGGIFRMHLAVPDAPPVTASFIIARDETSRLEYCFASPQASPRHLPAILETLGTPHCQQKLMVFYDPKRVKAFLERVDETLAERDGHAHVVRHFPELMELEPVRIVSAYTFARLRVARARQSQSAFPG